MDANNIQLRMQELQQTDGFADVFWEAYFRKIRIQTCYLKKRGKF